MEKYLKMILQLPGNRREKGERKDEREKEKDTENQ